MADLPPLPEGATSVSLPPLPEGATSTGGGAAMVSPKMGASTPASPETKGRVAKAVEATGKYLFSPTGREDFSGTEVLGGGATGAALSYGAPAIMEVGGKLLSAIPTAPTRFAGTALQAGGQALAKVPGGKRALVGGVGGATTETAEQGLEMMGMPRAVAYPLSALAVGTPSSVITNYLGKALNLEGRNLTNILRTAGKEKALNILEDAGLSRLQAQQELEAAQRIERQLSERGIKAESRAEAAQTGMPMASERQAVLDKVNRAKVEAGYAARDANMSYEQAQALVKQAEQRVLQTEQAVNSLQQDLLALPTMTKEQFGKRIQQTSQKIFDDNQALRKQAGIGNAIAAAGDRLSVSTANVNQTIGGMLESTRNPVTRQILMQVQKELDTKVGEDTFQGLSLKSADNLKGYLDSIINAKQFGDTKLDKTIVSEIRKVKGELMQSILFGNKPYLEALNKFRVLSRGLDIVERNGALAKVIEKDPLSTAYKMDEAAVVGAVISKARAGNKVFEKLLEANPTLQEPAKLYFTKELFGQDVAPTDAVIKTFLKNNEIPLNQLGLYKDFKDLRTAQRTAKDAVETAKGFEKGYKEGEKIAGAAAKSAEEEQKRLTGMSQTAQKRLAETIQTAEPMEKLLARSEARARPAEVKLKQRLGAAEKTMEQVNGVEKEYNSLVNDLSEMSSKEIPGAIKSAANKMLKQGYITQAERDAFVNAADKNANQLKDATAARRWVLGAVGTLGLTQLASKLTPMGDVPKYYR